ncbi:MAG: glycosyltransferase family 2 protein [Flavobacteriales bacterium]|nr:glycosyltransferase family 2 protein [Flavobacteriales bacterium]
MKLSVVIVNYNVQYFLEQCLLSVEKAMTGLTTEVWVVDNNSVDGSLKMIREKFPWVKLIANKDNVGFSRANNQAIELSSGEYVLLLNPDTLVEEDTFHKVVEFMDEHPQAGGLGVRMVDGKGVFLPESKRGLPTPATSFYKIFGISKLFPKSPKFNRYHLGNLSPDETHEIEILSGAFMLLRKKTLDQVGILDNDFFMYGEDIDLSWRIVKGGWKNYYFPGTRIIHYKGESTKKGSLNYVYVFYNAMVIFARKHFSEQHARLFSFFIQIAIWLRAGVAVLNRFVKRMMLPAADALIVLTGLFIAKDYYAASMDIIYDASLVKYGFVAYVLIWCFAAWVGGAYDKPWKPVKVIKPVIAGAAAILMIYSLLPESLRFSRALILIGTAIALVAFFLHRVVLNIIMTGKSGLKTTVLQRVAIVGEKNEALRVKNMLSQIQREPSFIAHVSHQQDVHPDQVGHIGQLDEIVRIHRIDQVIFCAKDISSSDIIGAMSSIPDKSIEFKIAPPESLYIIGSGSIETTADAFMMDVNSVSLNKNRRLKRIFDIIVSLLMILVLPIMLIVVHQRLGFIRNIFQVLTGSKTWVGYSPYDALSESVKALPKLKKGVIHPAIQHQHHETQRENLVKLNVLYAKDYKILNDLSIMRNGLRFLGS